MPRINNWFDLVFWLLFAGTALFILGTFLKILWDSFHIFSDRGMPRRGHARSAFGGLGGENINDPVMDATSDSTHDASVEIADSGGSDSGGGDFSGGGGDYGGGGSGGSWS